MGQSATAAKAQLVTADQQQPAVIKTYNISVIVHFKRSAGELDYAHRESERLHNLISSDKAIDWAQRRIEKIQEMVLMGPNADDLKAQLKSKLESEDDE